MLIPVTLASGDTTYINTMDVRRVHPLSPTQCEIFFTALSDSESMTIAASADEIVTRITETDSEGIDPATAECNHLYGPQQ